jgi:hypothetical protein
LEAETMDLAQLRQQDEKDDNDEKMDEEKECHQESSTRSSSQDKLIEVVVNKQKSSTWGRLSTIIKFASEDEVVDDVDPNTLLQEEYRKAHKPYYPGVGNDQSGFLKAAMDKQKEGVLGRISTIFVGESSATGGVQDSEYIDFEHSVRELEASEESLFKRMQEQEKDLGLKASKQAAAATAPVKTGLSSNL